jgi:hypothetical protein
MSKCWFSFYAVPKRVCSDRFSVPIGAFGARSINLCVRKAKIPAQQNCSPVAIETDENA